MTSTDPEAFVRVAILENGIEAQLLGAILTERDLPHRINSFYDTAYDGLFQMQRGWGEVYAPVGCEPNCRKFWMTCVAAKISLARAKNRSHNLVLAKTQFLKTILVHPLFYIRKN
jgi:hypothetical protein